MIFQEILMIILRKADKIVNYYWYNYPFGKKPKASKEKYVKIAKEARQKSYPKVDTFEKQTGYAINAEWLHELALHTQVVIKKSAINYQHGRLLYAALRRYTAKTDSKYINILETGTARGFSALCMAKAMADSGVEGKILTFDVLPHNAKMFWNCIDDHQGAQTRAQLLSAYSNLLARYLIFHQGDTKIELPKVQLSRVHFAFLDGAHKYKHVMKEFETIKDKQLPGDIIFFDDYQKDKYPGVYKAVNEICENQNYNKTIIDLGQRVYAIAEKLLN